MSQFSTRSARLLRPPTSALWALSLALMAGCPAVLPPGGNVAPVATDVNASAMANMAASLNLAATDANPGDTLTFTITTLPTDGTLTTADGSAIDSVPFDLTANASTVRYRPDAAFEGNDSFTFTASDGQAVSNPATVTIAVTPLQADETFSQDTTLQTLSIEDGMVVAIENNAVITVTGDATIDGLLIAPTGRVTLRVMGALVVDGTIQSVDPGIEDLDTEAPFTAQPAGIYIITGDGEVTLASDTVLETNGNIVLTDDEDVLDMTPAELFDEVEDVSADDLPTLVPLPPDNDAFNDPGNMKLSLGESPGRGANLQAALPPVTITGTWPPPGAAPVPGDKPVVIVRFNGPRDVNLDNLTINGPPAPPRPADDDSADPGNNAQGRDGRNGMRLNIRNNGGAINIRNAVVFNLTDGGPGADAAATCASATAGDGGNSGNFRMTASGGINLDAGTLTVNPGRGGHGGNATVNVGPAGAAGCPGEAGDPSTATGGNGSDNRKRLLVRGNVSSAGNITIGPITGGSGGTATSTACDGGDGIPCCDGGPGGAATSMGGNGGAASTNVGALPINTGVATGGRGGDATATGGAGGDGGSCKFDDAGNGGAGGAATATGGMGGDAANSGAGGAVAGNGGDATATGGEGGDGGDSGTGMPGTGGAGGTATTTAGMPGMAATAGQAGMEDATNGMAGANGGMIAVRLFCFPFTFLPAIPGSIAPGPQVGPVFAEDNITQLGLLGVEFVPQQMAQYLRGEDPDHIGIIGGTLSIDVDSLDLDDGEPGTVVGLRIEPLFGEGIDEQNPLVVEALDAMGEVIGTREFTSVPTNSGGTGEPETIDAEFDVDESVSEFRIIVPPNAFVTIIRLYLLDP